MVVSLLKREGAWRDPCKMCFARWAATIVSRCRESNSSGEYCGKSLNMSIMDAVLL
jgi:hypothetical protein